MNSAAPSDFFCDPTKDQLHLALSVGRSVSTWGDFFINISKTLKLGFVNTDHDSAAAILVFAKF